MITDNQTNFLFLSEKLREKTQFLLELLFILDRQKIKHEFLPFTNDIWAVDYMPIQQDLNKFIQFRYEPDYLQNKRFLSTQTDPKPVCRAIGLNALESGIKVDGGNVIRGKDWVILTEKIFTENPARSRSDLIEELEQLFQVKIIIIPREPGDFTGHADGIVRYYDYETVIVNSYRKNDSPRFQKKLSKCLFEQGIRTIEIPYNPYDNALQDMADGLYINFLQMEDFILLPTFNIKEDETAYLLFEQLFPGQQINTIDSRVISKDSGVLNCITWNIRVGEPYAGDFYVSEFRS
jgi:agmatine deiminase